MSDCVNECTDEITPDRVRNVPKIDNTNVPIMSDTFHRFSMPRFSWIITECRNAVSVNQESSGAFSTGSHAQTPPQPSSTYAHHMPSVMPIERKSHEARAHFRIATIQPVSSARAMSAAIANAYGMVMLI